MATYRTTFRTVKKSESMKMKCRGCGKKMTRVISAEQTLNPWNKIGCTIKTEYQINFENTRAVASDKKLADRFGIFCDVCEESLLSHCKHKWRESSRKSKDSNAVITTELCTKCGMSRRYFMWTRAGVWWLYTKIPASVKKAMAGRVSAVH